MVEIDFETYSSAGYYQDAAGKWRGLVKTSPGLAAVGAPAYAEHPSTRVLCLAYEFDDQQGPRIWVPGMEPPTDLFAHIAAGGLLEAWNSAFEYHIWRLVCHRRMGWPELPYQQLRCAMSRARAHSLPGKLSKAAEAIGAGEQKDKAGELLIRKLCVPHNNKPPTGADYNALYKYCLQDIRAEASVSALCPSLSDNEQVLWLLDQAINFRGVAIDTGALADCISVVSRVTERYTGELQQLTGGAVQSAGELAKITAWLATQHVHTTSLESDRVEELLAEGWLQGPARRVLEIRASLGAASVKKLFAIERRLSGDGRLRDLFAFCGADRTGRWAGRGPQPQNLPGGLPSEEVDEMLAAMPAREPELDAIAEVSGCLRGLFVAADGHDLVCSDFSAIEAVVLAELAGEAWRQEVFRTHGKIYEMSASILTGVPLSEYLEYKRANDSHHPHRKRGKVAELACFTRDTLLLTDRGYVSMVDVKHTDRLWDGVEWVEHQGVVSKGKRKVIDVDGVKVTPNHPISLGHSWKEAGLLASNRNILSQALATGSESIRSLCMSIEAGSAGARYAYARAVLRNSLTSQTSTAGKLPGAAIAAESKPRLRGSNCTPSTPTFCPTQNIAAGWSTDSGQPLPGVTPLTPKGTKTMGGEVLKCAQNGEGRGAQVYSSRTLSRLTAGIYPNWRWTGKIRIKAMRRVTSGLYPDNRMQQIKGQYRRCNDASSSWRNVYDIAHAGPRNRFTIKTSSGHLVVHNSGYGGGLGAWKAFGADEFMTDDEIQDAVRAWRAASPAVTGLWWGLQDAAMAALSCPGQCYAYRGISYGVSDGILYCLLPSGRRLTYHQPQTHQKMMPWGKLTTCITYLGWNSNYLNGPIGWMRMETYGPKLVENVVQAVARDILANSMTALEAAGYPIVLHVHDEIVAEVPHGVGSVEEFERIMGQMPRWAEGWPVRAAGGWRGRRYRKE